MRTHGVRSRHYQNQLQRNAGSKRKTPVVLRRPGTSLFALLSDKLATGYTTPKGINIFAEKAKPLAGYEATPVWHDEVSKMPDLTTDAIKKMQESLHKMMTSKSYFTTAAKLPGKSVGWTKLSEWQ